MNPRQRKTLLWSLAMLVALGGVAILLTGAALPVKVADVPSAQLNLALKNLGASDRTQTNQAENSTAPTLAELQQLAATNLRRPLAGQPGPEGATPTDAPLTLQLAGTVSEPGHSVAMLKKSDGSIVVCALGESVDDVGGPVMVMAVEVDRIRVKYGNSQRELRLPPAATGLEGIAP